MGPWPIQSWHGIRFYLSDDLSFSSTASSMPDLAPDPQELQDGQVPELLCLHDVHDRLKTISCQAFPDSWKYLLAKEYHNYVDQYFMPPECFVWPHIQWKVLYEEQADFNKILPLLGQFPHYGSSNFQILKSSSFNFLMISCMQEPVHLSFRISSQL